MAKPSYNPEKRAWRGRSYKKGGQAVSGVRDASASSADERAPGSLKNDPDMHVKQVLATHKRSHIFGDVSRWLEMELSGPLSFKKQWILAFADGAHDDSGLSSKEDWEIDAKDPTTWPGEVEDMPDDKFFIDLYAAMKQDEKRRDKRNSYEF